MNKITKSLSCFICALFCVLTIAGCGFKIRSQNSFPPEMHKIYLQADNPFGPLEIAFKKDLKSSGIILVKNPNEAPLTLHLTAVDFSGTQVSSGPSSQARTYSLVYTAAFYISNAAGKTILDMQTVTSSRSLNLSANEIFEVSSQVDVLKQNMQQEVITKMFDILTAKRIFEVLKKTSVT